jgi:hypothetical protein
VAFVECGLIRGVAFGECDLIRGVAFVEWPYKRRTTVNDLLYISESDIGDCNLLLFFSWCKKCINLAFCCHDQILFCSSIYSSLQKNIVYLVNIGPFYISSIKQTRSGYRRIMVFNATSTIFQLYCGGGVVYSIMKTIKKKKTCMWISYWHSKLSNTSLRN